MVDISQDLVASSLITIELIHPKSGASKSRSARTSDDSHTAHRLEARPRFPVLAGQKRG